MTALCDQKVKIIRFISSFIFFAAVSFAEQPDEEITVSADEQGLLIDFRPQGWNVKNVEWDNGSGHLYTFTGAATFGEPGSPHIPCRAVTIGIPPQGDVALEIVDSDFILNRQSPAAPVAHLHRQDGLWKKIYRPGSGVVTVYPAEIVRLEKPVFFRNQRVVRLVFFPLQVLPESRVRQYQRIIVRVNFDTAQSGFPADRPQKDEHLYKNLLLNDRQAKTWRVKRTKVSKPHSIFSGRTLYKVVIGGDGRRGKEGIYQIDGARLSAAGVNLAALDPNTIQLFCHGRLLTGTARTLPDSLLEIPIQVVDGGDTRFEQDDYILFYGTGAGGIEFRATYDTTMGRLRHYIHPYGTENVYWLSLGQSAGKRISSLSSIDPDGLKPEPSFRDLVYVEDERYNLYQSGIDWFGFELATDKGRYGHNFEMPGALPAGHAEVRFKLAMATYLEHRFEFFINGFNIGTKTGHGVYNGYEPVEFIYPVRGMVEDGDNAVQIDYETGPDYASAFVDWIEIEYDRIFRAKDGQLIFRAPLRDGPAVYAVTGLQKNVQIFDITDLTAVQKIENVSYDNGTVSFAAQAQAKYPRHYIAVNHGAYKAVTGIVRENPSDLRRPRDVDYIIITHDHFKRPAEELASLRENWDIKDRLETEVVCMSDVFDEFGGGVRDPAAIKSFLTFAQTYWGGPAYVLLLGDGHYDYKNILKFDTPNFIPPYESNDRYERKTRVTDDWFTYTKGYTAGMQMAIGRLPARTIEEAQYMVDKIVAYETNPVYGEWRKTITLVADDELAQTGREDEDDHTDQAEILAENYTPPFFNLKKIYLVDYPAVRTASVAGRRKPLASDAIIEQINRGTLILNYIGHANDELWSHEQVLYGPTDFERIRNGRRTAFWIVASCEFAHWDQPDGESLAEQIFCAAGRGAVAMFASSRVAFGIDNASLNYYLYRHLFAGLDSTGKTARLGDAVLLAKKSYFNRVNNEKYILLGDPAMRLGVPEYQAVIEDISPDSIMALTKMSVKGSVRKNGHIWPDLKAAALVRVLDSEIHKSYVTAQNTKIDYTVPGNSIFRGKVEVTDGRFAVDFIVPKDISYGGNDGKVSLYFWNETCEGAGHFGGLPVGGTAVNLVDNDGPRIDLHFGDPDFVAGDFCPPNPVLHVQICDSLSGVNIAGDIGHQITLTLDEDYAGTRDITEYFQYHTGSYLSGGLEYPIHGLAEGPHHVLIKAWDNSNNSSVCESFFTVIAEKDLKIRNLLSYPNPMRRETQFCFELSRNAQVVLKIYTLGGKAVREFSPVFGNIGFNLFPEIWDGTDNEGDRLANGVYLYKLVARATVDNENKHAEKIGKLVIVN